jgi:hypothetical protein
MVAVMRRLSIRRLFTCGLATAICACCTLAVTAARCQESGKRSKPSSEVEHCKRINDEQARMRCNQGENPKASTTASAQQPAASGTWQLARIPNPAGGPDTISITKITNAIPSDQDIAGLMLRCGEGVTTEVLVVLTEPLPLRTHPKVTVVAGPTTTEFIASVVTPGSLVLLPEKASALVESTWQSAPELAVSIAQKPRPLNGVIQLTDIGTAMGTLQSNCPKAAHGPPPQHSVTGNTRR